MSGASGKVPAAIHITPEARQGGPLARIQNGDWISLDATAGSLSVELSAKELAERELAPYSSTGNSGVGREFFGLFRQTVTGAEQGASVLFEGLRHQQPSQLQTQVLKRCTLNVGSDKTGEASLVFGGRYRRD